MGQLAKTHKLCFNVVREAVSEEIKVSMGDRFQGNIHPEVTIKQSTFDVLNLSNDDYAVFEYDVSSYAKDYYTAATIADTIYDACPGQTSYINFEGETYQVVALDMFMQFTDRDDWEASVLVRIRKTG